jgi:hypothetical protein
VALLWLRANTHPVLPEFLSEAAAMPEPCVGADGGRRVELHTFTFRADAEDASPRSPSPLGGRREAKVVPGAFGLWLGRVSDRGGVGSAICRTSPGR